MPIKYRYQWHETTIRVYRYIIVGRKCSLDVNFVFQDASSANISCWKLNVQIIRIIVLDIHSRLSFSSYISTESFPTTVLNFAERQFWIIDGAALSRRSKLHTFFWLRTAHSSVNFCRFPQGQALYQTFQKLLDFKTLNSSRVLQITALTTLKIFSNLLEYTHSFPTVLTTNNSLRAIWWPTRKGSLHGENSQKNEWLFHEKKSKGNSDNSKKIIILTCE